MKGRTHYSAVEKYKEFSQYKGEKVIEEKN